MIYGYFRVFRNHAVYRNVNGAISLRERTNSA